MRKLSMQSKNSFVNVFVGQIIQQLADEWATQHNPTKVVENEHGVFLLSNETDYVLLVNNYPCLEATFVTQANSLAEHQEFENKMWNIIQQVRMQHIDI